MTRFEKLHSKTKRPQIDESISASHGEGGIVWVNCLRLSQLGRSVTTQITSCGPSLRCDERRTQDDSCSDCPNRLPILCNRRRYKTAPSDSFVAPKHKCAATFDGAKTMHRGWAVIVDLHCAHTDVRNTPREPNSLCSINRHILCASNLHSKEGEREQVSYALHSLSTQSSTAKRGRSQWYQVLHAHILGILCGRAIS